MGTLFGFVVGYVVGARAGGQGFDEVIEAAQSIRQSDEFQSFVNVLKEHAKGTARVVGDRLAGGAPSQAEDVLARARARLG